MSMPGSDPLQYVSLGQLAERTARRHGRREAVVAVEEGVRLTYEQLLDKVSHGHGRERERERERE